MSDGSGPALHTAQLTQRCAAGDPVAYDQLFSAIYNDLHQRARRMLRSNAGSTLSTTALVHETYLKLSGSRLALQDRMHFFSIAACAMRQVLMNAARDRNAIKRGGDLDRVTLGAVGDGEGPDLLDLLSLDEALTALGSQDARLAQVVELHFFAGLGFSEIAQLLDLSERTVARDWRAARALLRLHMTDSA
ncbi:MAG: hypothetical protein GX826_01075 [Gammaproteobacteria bacterium]|nr:hypothetical protein [Gammaproteobacteria bacterium]